jgi:hypothetical protein
MNIQFEYNEFTTHELMQYIKAAYGTQINGAAFRPINLSNWIRIKKIPEAYGGHRITSIKTIEGINNARVLTIEGLTRDVLVSLDLLSKKIRVEIPKLKRARKQRTPFYYKILEKAGKQYTKKTKQISTIPESWKTIGIKQNQLTKTRNRKIAINSQQ